MITPATIRAPLPWLLLALALALTPARGEAEYRQLCASVPSACEYTGPQAPKLDVDVCYGDTTGARLMTGSCPTGTWPYRVTHGEVLDPATNEVAAYVPLDDRCSVPGACVDYVAHDDGWESVICCVSAAECYEGVTCGGVFFWCFDGVSNEDGTVTCFNGEEAI
jgi:hypothetical protein